MSSFKENIQDRISKKSLNVKQEFLSRAMFIKKRMRDKGLTEENILEDFEKFCRK